MLRFVVGSGGVDPTQKRHPMAKTRRPRSHACFESGTDAQAGILIIYGGAVGVAMWRGGKCKKFRLACVSRDTNLWLRPWRPSLYLHLRAAGHLTSLASGLQEQDERAKAVP